MKLQPIQVHEIEGLTPEQTAQHKSLAADTAEHNRQCAANAEGVQSLGAVAWDQHATKEAANLAHEKSALRADNLRLRKSLDDFFDDIAPARGALLTKAFAHHEQTQADLRQVMSKLGFVFPPEGEGARFWPRWRRIRQSGLRKPKSKDCRTIPCVTGGSKTMRKSCGSKSRWKRADNAPIRNHQLTEQVP